MANTVSAQVIRRKLENLGWPFQIAEIAQFLSTQQVPVLEFVAYADACLASGDGVDDSQIQGCSPANGAKITAALRSRGIVL